MDNKSSNIKERVLQIAEFKGVAKEKFIEKIGMTYGNFKGKSKLTPLNSNAIADILSFNSEINPEWLLTGEGEMLKQKSKEFPTDNKEEFSNGDNYTFVLQKKYIEQLETNNKKDNEIYLLKTEVKELKTQVEILKKENNIIKSKVYEVKDYNSNIAAEPKQELNR